MPFCYNMGRVTAAFVGTRIEFAAIAGLPVIHVLARPSATMQRDRFA